MEPALRHPVRYILATVTGAGFLLLLGRVLEVNDEPALPTAR